MSRSSSQIAIAAAFGAVLATPLYASGHDIDIICDFDGIVIDGEEQVTCYDLDLVYECMFQDDYEESCFNEDTEAGPVFDPATMNMKAKSAGAQRLKRLMRKDRMLKLKR